MAMKFDAFIAEVESAMRSAEPSAAFGGTDGKAHASWTLRERSAAVELVPPLNVSVTLKGSQDPVTTWYPIDPVLVPVVSKRIAGYLSEA